MSAGTGGGRSMVEGLFALVIAVALLTLAAVATSGSGGADVRASTYVDGRSGFRALYLLLGALDVDVTRLARPIDSDLSTDRTMIVAAPSWPMTRGEAAATLDWVASGGRLVVIDAVDVEGATGDARPLLLPLGLDVEPSDQSAVEVLGDRLSSGVVETSWRPRQQFKDAADQVRDPRAGTTETLMVCDDKSAVTKVEPGDDPSNRAVPAAPGRVVVRIPFHRGEVIACADVAIFSNLMLRESDNAVLVTNLILDHPAYAAHVTFDEFHHGAAENGSRLSMVRHLWNSVAHTWPGRGLALLVLAALVYAFGAAVRLGAPLPERPAPRRALREHAEALGRLLGQAKSRAETLHILVDGVRRVCAPRAGLPSHAPVSEFVARLRASTAVGAGELADATLAASGAADRSNSLGRPAQISSAAFASLAARLAAARRSYLHG